MFQEILRQALMALRRADPDEQLGVRLLEPGPLLGARHRVDEVLSLGRALVEEVTRDWEPIERISSPV